MQQQSSIETRSLLASRAEMSEVLMLNDTDNLGCALGGRTLKWMDVCGATAERCLVERQVVTASMGYVDLLVPTDVGDVVTIEAYVFGIDRTSTDIKVDVTAEHPNEGDRREIPTPFFTFVAFDGDEKPIPVPDLVCDS